PARCTRTSVGSGAASSTAFISSGVTTGIKVLYTFKVLSHSKCSHTQSALTLKVLRPQRERSYRCASARAPSPAHPAPAPASPLFLATRGKAYPKGRSPPRHPERRRRPGRRRAPSSPPPWPRSERRAAGLDLAVAHRPLARHR